MGDVMAPEGFESLERPEDPCVLVIFGAAGDLMQRLLMPSLTIIPRAITSSTWRLLPPSSVRLPSS